MMLIVALVLLAAVPARMQEEQKVIDMSNFVVKESVALSKFIDVQDKLISALGADRNSLKSLVRSKLTDDHTPVKPPPRPPTRPPTRPPSKPTSVQPPVDEDYLDEIEEDDKDYSAHYDDGSTEDQDYDSGSTEDQDYDDDSTEDADTDNCFGVDQQQLKKIVSKLNKKVTDSLKKMGPMLSKVKKRWNKIQFAELLKQLYPDIIDTLSKQASRQADSCSIKEADRKEIKKVANGLDKSLTAQLKTTLKDLIGNIKTMPAGYSIIPKIPKIPKFGYALVVEIVWQVVGHVLSSS